MQDVRGRLVASGEGAGIPEAASVELTLNGTERDRQGDGERDRCIASQKYRAEAWIDFVLLCWESITRAFAHPNAYFVVKHFSLTKHPDENICWP